MSTSEDAVLRGDTERIAIGDEANIQDPSMGHAEPGYPRVVRRRVAGGHRAILHGCVVGDEGQIGMGEILLDGVRVGRGPRARWAAMPRWLAGSTVRSS